MFQYLFLFSSHVYCYALKYQGKLLVCENLHGNKPDSHCSFIIYKFTVVYLTHVLMFCINIFKNRKSYASISLFYEL